MTIRFLKRASASIGAIVAALSVTPALADSSMDAGPVTVTLGGFIATEGVYRSRNETTDIGSSFSGVSFSSSP
jgi:hypothetical protein